MQGSAPLGAGDLDLAIDLQSFPLALIDRIAGNRGLRGTVTGTGHATGPLADPAVSFDLRGEGIAATVLSRERRAAARPPPPPAATAAARSISPPPGSPAPAASTCRAPAASPSPAPASTPTSRAPCRWRSPTPCFAARSAQATGTLRVTATARGSLGAPQLGGTVTLGGGTLFDPQTNIRLSDISLDAGLEGNAAILRSFRARVVTGGNITAEGRVTLAPGYPADLTARLNNVRYTDGVFVSTRLDGELAMRGPLVGGGGMLSGEIDLGRTEISIAEGLGPNVEQALNQIDHVDPVRRRAARRWPAPGSARPPPRAPERPRRHRPRRADPRAQPDLRARPRPRRRARRRAAGAGHHHRHPAGRPVRPAPRPAGGARPAHRVRRGLAAAGRQPRPADPLRRPHHLRRRHRDRHRGRPGLRAARSPSPPSRELPQDEVLARVLFNSTTQNLSAFQLAQLAGAAAELAGGGGGPGILSQIRGATGLDDLDIITQDDGSTAVRAGKYLDEQHLSRRADRHRGHQPRRDQPRRQRQPDRAAPRSPPTATPPSACSSSATTDRGTPACERPPLPIRRGELIPESIQSPFGRNRDAVPPRSRSPLRFWRWRSPPPPTTSTSTPRGTMRPTSGSTATSPTRPASRSTASKASRRS